MNLSNKKSIQNFYNTLLASPNFDLEQESRMIMYRFLSEVDEIMEEREISKKDLASMIKTSPSYITQLFRGSKLINILTIAKIQQALDIEFSISIKDKEKNNAFKDDVQNYLKNNLGKDFFIYYKTPVSPKYDNDFIEDDKNRNYLVKHA